MTESARDTAGGIDGSAGLVELHTHLEGSLTPARLIALADKYGQPGLPSRCLDGSGEHYVFSGFSGFIDLFKNATSLIRTPGDFHTLALDLGEQLAADGVTYAEVTLSYGVMLRRNLDPVAVQTALGEAAAEIRENRGIELGWIPDAVRQWGVDEGWRAWEAAAVSGRRSGVVGFGLGGDETSGPAEEFAELFAEVRREGLGVTIHAGEVTAMGAAAVESVRQAVLACGARRIGHGVAAAADPAVLDLLATGDVFVELCPGSNLLTGAVDRPEAHPLRRFLEAGVPCCLNTDDRAMFGLDLRREYTDAAEVHGLTPAEKADMQKAARKAAFREPVS